MTDESIQTDLKILHKHLAHYGQEHLLRFWDRLEPRQQSVLVEQIEQIDLELIQSLFRGADGFQDWATLAQSARPPRALRLRQRESMQKSPSVPPMMGWTAEEARHKGIETLSRSEVGVLLVAGGQGSRLGFDLPKSLYPIGPHSRATLLQIHVEKILAASERYDVSIPLYLMTSPATHGATCQFLEENNRLGLAETDLFVFCQGTMPAVDAETGKLLLADAGEVFLAPDGHGGAVAALDSSGAIEHMQGRGIRDLFYLQVDNPLAPIVDSELVGAHRLAESELTSLAIAKGDPRDKLGNFVMIDGRLHVIEYSDFPDDLAERCNEAGELEFWAGSVAIHMMNVSFLQRCLSLRDSLPFHVAHKGVSAIVTEGVGRGDQVVPVVRDALKFERFIFDLMPHANRPIVVEYAEQESFAPLKNGPGADKDTPAYVQQMMTAQHRRWLEAAGATFTDNGGQPVSVEISPLWAMDAEGVARRLRPGTVFDKSVYLR
jgi:UDP-N-acetylglucosamine/UDP-N-acetylgalactosamine diphosphorylase